MTCLCFYCVSVCIIGASLGVKHSFGPEEQRGRKATSVAIWVATLLWYPGPGTIWRPCVPMSCRGWQKLGVGKPSLGLQLPVCQVEKLHEQLESLHPWKQGRLGV